MRKLYRALVHACLLPLALAGAALAAGGPAPRWSQLAEVGFQHLTREQGLPNAVVTSVAQDHEGFLWVGTLGGLARWDGYRFRVFSADPRSRDLLPDNVVQAVHTDSAGRVWVGTSGAGLLRYDRVQDRFEQFAPAAVPGRGPSHVSVRSLLDDGAGGLWVGTEAGLDRLGADGRFTRVPLVPLGGGPSPAVVALARDGGGQIWAASSAGLFKAPAGGAGGFSPVLLHTGTDGEPAVSSLLVDGRNTVWVGTRQHGLYGIAAGAPPQRLVGGPATGLPGAATVRYVSSLLETRPGELWVGTRDDGIYVVAVADGQVRRLRHRPALPSSLLDNTVRGLLRDRAGVVWVATHEGLSRHDPGQHGVLNVYGARTEPDAPPTLWPLSNPNVSAIAVMPDGRLWLGTHRNGIDIVDPQGARVAELRADFNRPETALPRDFVLALERAADGSVFIGTQRGLYRASADGSGVVRLHVGGRDPAASTWVLRAEGDTLWVGGEADGLWRFDLRSGQARAIDGLADRRITVLRHSPDGAALWVGTRNGVEVLDLASGRVRRVSAADGAAAGFITALHHDRQGRLWVGRYGNGLDILPRSAASGTVDAAQVRHVGAAQGLPDDNVNALIEDAQGQLWVSTDSGLGRIHPQTLAVHALRRAEGAVFPLYWTGSAARTAQGELLFGGAGGLTVVQPAEVKAWHYQPQVRVSELRIGGRRVPAPTTASSVLEVRPDANSLSVEFSGDDLSAPERNRHAYRLEGYDSDWVETDIDHRLASYNNLPPREYRLRLRVSNRDGVWAEHELALAIRVLPAWHQTLWFHLLCVMAAAAALWAVVQMRTRWLRRRQAELQAKVQERTAALEEVSRELREKSRVLEESSLSDPLTGLRNRRFLSEHIDSVVTASLRRALDQPGATDTDNLFLLVDIDHFKQVNDQHGHAAGDAVLVQFAQRLRLAMRESDLLVRWGGEEFLVVARDTDRARAEELAERLREHVAGQPFVMDNGRLLYVTCSIGLACMPFIEHEPRALGWQDVINLADVALLAAKRMGRNGWIALQATPATRAAGLLARVQATPQRALEDGELQLSGSRPPAELSQALQDQAA